MSKQVSRHAILACKVYMPNLVSYFNWTPILKWYVIKGGFKNDTKTYV